MMNVPDEVIKAYDSIQAGLAQFERLGELFAISSGFACFKSDARTGFDVSLPAYTIDLSGVVTEVPPLTDAWFTLCEIDAVLGQCRFDW
ncbi:hypothetical protein [Collinsella provencensis]|uniref:hypothetical protein n=1 Tax=Collinsella provencensis TaxID=1937461 RepID=UPI000C834C89|nr:hypothetical protein [Collinsella provencensis]